MHCPASRLTPALSPKADANIRLRTISGRSRLLEPGLGRCACTVPKGAVCEVAHTDTKQHPCKLTIQVTEVIWGDNWQPIMG
jgi:hypothetical protein